MWFDGTRKPDTLYVANTSRGKDSTAMLRAIELMGWPLDMIVSVDIWATQDIPAELPPMVAFKDEYDQKVLDWFGIPVTRLCATKRERERDCATPICSTEFIATEKELEKSTGGQCSLDPTAESSRPRKLTYEDIFYRKRTPERERERELQRGRNESGDFRIYGFPMRKGDWCKSDLKRAALAASRISGILGVPENSSGQHCRVSVEKWFMVSGQAQRNPPR